jgi:hypothetical protein
MSCVWQTIQMISLTIQACFVCTVMRYPCTNSCPSFMWLSCWLKRRVGSEWPMESCTYRPVIASCSLSSIWSDRSSNEGNNHVSTTISFVILLILPDSLATLSIISSYYPYSHLVNTFTPLTSVHLHEYRLQASASHCIRPTTAECMKVCKRSHHDSPGLLRRTDRNERTTASWLGRPRRPGTSPPHFGPRDCFSTQSPVFLMFHSSLERKKGPCSPLTLINQRVTHMTTAKAIWGRRLE